jgi:hypothetical protein
LRFTLARAPSAFVRTSYTKPEITTEVVRKATIPVKLRDSCIRREKIGGAKKYAMHPAARLELTMDETKSPQGTAAR